MGRHRTLELNDNIVTLTPGASAVTGEAEVSATAICFAVEEADLRWGPCQPQTVTLGTLAQPHGFLPLSCGVRGGPPNVPGSLFKTIQPRGQHHASAGKTTGCDANTPCGLRLKSQLLHCAWEKQWKMAQVLILLAPPNVRDPKEAPGSA